MTSSQSTPAGKGALWTGRVMSGLVVFALGASALMKLAGAQEAVDGFAAQGWPPWALNVVGIAELACALIYAIPRLSVLGAILSTGYLGGAVAVHVHFDPPGFIIPVIIGVLAWGGLFLRDPRLRALIPLVR
jgi:hypothetical protein